MLRLKLFGVGQAQYLDKPLGGFPNQQCYFLLCYLLLNRSHFHSREQLALNLWQENSNSDLRKQLRNALWRLRQTLQAVGAPVDEYLYVSEDVISFVNTGSYWLDIESFEKTLNAFLDVPGKTMTLEQIGQLEQAIALYSGDLLEGVQEDWCLYEREWLRKSYLTTLNKLMDFHEAHANHERALAYGKQILACDPVHERIHRRLMRLYWQVGDRNAALAQYKRCRQILHQELDVPPMPETEQLYQQMRANRYAPGRPNHPIAANGSARPTSNQDLAGQALQRIRQLKLFMEEANDEIRHLEALFHGMNQDLLG